MQPCTMIPLRKSWRCSSSTPPSFLILTTGSNLPLESPSTSNMESTRVPLPRHFLTQSVDGGMKHTSGKLIERRVNPRAPIGRIIIKRQLARRWASAAAQISSGQVNQGPSLLRVLTDRRSLALPALGGRDEAVDCGLRHSPQFTPLCACGAGGRADRASGRQRT